MKHLLYILISVLIVGCAKKEIKLPVLGVPGVNNIQNHSEVWFFYGSDNGKMNAKVNRKNTISTTHWIYNIDKRLTLELIVPHLIKLKDKHKNAVHSTDGMKDYFSYADTLSNQVALLAFDSVNFKIKSPFDDLSAQVSEPEDESENVKIHFTLYGFQKDGRSMSIENFEFILNELKVRSSTEGSIELFLSFEGQLTYQDYMYYRTMIHKHTTSSFIVNPIELILI